MEDSFALFPLLFIFFFLVLGVVTFIFWIWTLIDCVSNEPSEGNDKIMWVIIILVLQWLGALIYVFVRRPQRIRLHGK